MGDNILDEKLYIEINELKQFLYENAHIKQIDTINELLKIAESKTVIDEALDESKEAMNPLGGIIIEIQNCYINYGKSDTETTLGA